MSDHETIDLDKLSLPELQALADECGVVRGSWRNEAKLKSEITNVLTNAGTTEPDEYDPIARAAGVGGDRMSPGQVAREGHGLTTIGQEQTVGRLP